MAVAPFSINDSIPDEEEIKWEVSHMQYNCSGVPSGMRADHLRKWLKEDQKEEGGAETTMEAGWKQGRR